MTAMIPKPSPTATVPQSWHTCKVPLVDIHVIRGSCTPEQKRQMMEETTEMIGRVLAEPVKQLTWVRIIEVGENEWMIGGEVFTLDHVRKLRAGELGR